MLSNSNERINNNSAIISFAPPQRKKPKQAYFKNSTWSSAPPQELLPLHITKKISDDQQQQTIKSNAAEGEQDDFIVTSINQTSTEERIKLYEQKYKSCMESKTQLSTWVKSTKKKGPPAPLTEGIFN